MKEQSGSDLRGRVHNCESYRHADCETQKQDAERIMTSPARLNLDELESRNLVFAPLPEIEILNYSEEMFCRWERSFTDGVTLLDSFSSETMRFDKCWRVKFRDAWSLRNSGMMGRFFIWIQWPWEFIVIDFREFSGIGGRREIVEKLLGRDLPSVLDEMRSYSEKVSDTVSRDFYSSLTEYYTQQILGDNQRS